jgi:hypothetical protein
MLEHDSMDIAIRAAKEVRRAVASTSLPPPAAAGEDDVAVVLKWWSEQGAFQDWNDSATAVQ